MFSYFQENLVLILAIAGAVISFLIFLTEKVVRKQKMRLFLILATMGFLILTGQQVIEYLEKNNSALLDKARDDIVLEIKKKVTITLTIVEQLSKELKGKSPEKIGVELVQSTETNELLQYSKGPPEAWVEYAEWLEYFRGQEKKYPCLSLTVNANNHYRISLLLAYLFTNSETRLYIEDAISQYRWPSFPDTTFINSYHYFPEPDIKYVLIYDGVSGTLIGYADAKLFAEELLLYKITEKTSLVENILNKKVSDPIVNMKKHFKTFKSNVAIEKDAFTVASKMLEEKIDEMAVIYEKKLYLVNLSKIVKLVL